MSTNPFRRSSHFDASGSNYNTTNSEPHLGGSEQNSRSTAALSISTKAQASSQKHVNFASPPAVPISPVSYPPSPESIRISPAFSSAHPVLPEPTDYSQAIQSDPFQAEAETDEDDGAIEQALHNAKVNTEIVSRSPASDKEDPVKKTLSKFASTPKRASTAGQNAQLATGSNRQTMDVDAFKRLLLTGSSGEDSTQLQSTKSTPQPIAQGWMLPQDFPRSPDNVQPAVDLNIPNTDPAVISSASSDIGETKEKPAPPKSRHGRAIVDKALPIPPGAEQRPSIDQRSSYTYDEKLPAESDNTATPRRAPPPPLSRRRSHNNGVTRNTSSRHSSISDQELPTVSAAHTARVPPPPPPTRRPNLNIERRPSSDLPPTVEETDTLDAGTPSSDQMVSTRSPQGNFKSPSTSKRMSLGPANPPPLPPPRRGRGSSRSSIDSQRPVLPAVTGDMSSSRNSGEYQRIDGQSRKASSATNAGDILASLAALQQEVDNARRSAV